MKERLIRLILLLVSLLTPILLIIFLIHIVLESYPILSQVGLNIFSLESKWRPLAQNPSYNILPMLLSSLYVSFLAILIATPISVCSAIFLNFYLSKNAAKTILSFIDIIAGIPSVIMGFMGLMILVKLFENFFKMTSGESVLTASILLAIMLFPFIISSSYESIEKAKKLYLNSALSLGISKEFIIRKIIFKDIKLGIGISMITAFGRAMGETMAVMMVMGNSPVFPKLLGRAETIPALTALEISSAEYGSLHLSAIYSANLILIILLVIIMITIHFFKRKQ